MTETVVDSSVVIDFLRGHEAARSYIGALRRAAVLATHPVVVAEVLTGARNRREQDAIEALFRGFRVVPVSDSDATTSIDFLKRLRLSRGVGWLDCLIAATCLRTTLPLATLNEKHFSAFEDLKIERPYG